MHLKGVTIHAEQFPNEVQYPFNLPVFHHTKRIAFDTPVTLLVGENGTGKSTLLEALAHASGIHIWRDVERNRFEINCYEDRFCDYLTVEWTNGSVPGSFFGSETFRQFAQILDEWAVADPGQLRYFGGKSLMTQSHGQSLMSYFQSRYRIKGLYLMDEPETALSPKSQLELLQILTQMSGMGHAQFIIATHSPMILACPGATVLSFDHLPVKQVSYEETDHYQIYRGFLIDRTRYLKQI